MKNITLKDLIDLGIIDIKKKKNKKTKKRKLRQQRYKSRGYDIGGLKSDSSHMKGYSQSMPFSNTSNIQTEIQHLQRKMLEDQIQNPDRFKKEEPKNNLLTIEDFKKSLNPFMNKFIEDENRFRNLERVGNQLLSDLKYGSDEFIGNYKPSKIEELPEDDIDETNKYFDDYDDSGIITSNPENYFVNEGNTDPYQEIEVNKIPLLDEKIFKETQKQPTLDDTPQKEIIQQEAETPSSDIKSPVKAKLYSVEPSDAIPNNYKIAKERYKKLLLQFGKTEKEIDDELKDMKNIKDIREDYKYYYEKAIKHNKKAKKNKV